MKTADEGYQLLAAQYMLKQLRLLSRHVEGARQVRDIEHVHQARVASRRLRAAIRMFRRCFPARQEKQWRTWIRRLTVGLGPARDKDVQIEFVRGYLAELDDRPARPGVKRLLVRLGQERRALQPKVVKTVDRLLKAKVLTAMRAVMTATRADLRARHVKVQSPYALRRAGTQIGRRVARLLACQDCLDDPADKLRHHQMRILAKRLRYTMEISAPLYEGRLDEPIKTVKALQTLLGEIHDCDVWMERLPDFLASERKRAEKYYGQAGPSRRLETGIEQLSSNRHQRRDEAFAELVSCWRLLQEQDFWASLARLAPTGQDRTSPDVAEGDEVC